MKTISWDEYYERYLKDEWESRIEEEEHDEEEEYDEDEWEEYDEDEEFDCSVCGMRYKGYMHNPWPLVLEEGSGCCDRCNMMAQMAKIELLFNCKTPEQQQRYLNLPKKDKVMMLVGRMEEFERQKEESRNVDEDEYDD